MNLMSQADIAFDYAGYFALPEEYNRIHSGLWRFLLENYEFFWGKN